ncbi:MAG: hypothetical protein D6680_22735 [Cyanobacteria bacterium J007]|nr:MAG: hypothetical protein D6680_22735 [Cyanobacteria bacterium J007]
MPFPLQQRRNTTSIYLKVIMIFSIVWVLCLKESKFYVKVLSRFLATSGINFATKFVELLPGKGSIEVGSIEILYWARSPDRWRSKMNFKSSDL